MISEERVEQAVEFISAHAAEIGRLRGMKAYLDHKAKVVRSQQFLENSGTVAEREAMALASSEYIAVSDEIKDCVTDLDTLATRFKGAEATIEVWRTQQANNRRGNI